MLGKLPTSRQNSPDTRSGVLLTEERSRKRDYHGNRSHGVFARFNCADFHVLHAAFCSKCTPGVHSPASSRERRRRMNPFGLPPLAITPATTVDDVLARYPITFSVLNAFGVDSCCGGSASLREAAAHALADESVLLDALQMTARDAGYIA